MGFEPATFNSESFKCSHKDCYATPFDQSSCLFLPKRVSAVYYSFYDLQNCLDKYSKSKLGSIKVNVKSTT